MMWFMKRKSYPSDLSDEQWKRLEPHLPQPRLRGAPRRVNLREILNGLLYLSRTGCQWRMLPHDLPPWETVYAYFKQWRDDGTWGQLNRELRIEVRLSAGRESEPSAAILDSQSVKTTESSGERGYDAGKKVNGVKRHVLVDTLGLILLVKVLTADIQDRDGARILLEQAKGSFPRLQKIWADGGYAGVLIDWVKRLCGWVLEIVKRSDRAQGFEVLPHRWIVERTFGWLNRSRRLSKNYERRTASSEAMVYLAMLPLMTRRLAKQSTCFA
jgi:putative transposase